MLTGIAALITVMSGVNVTTVFQGISAIENLASKQDVAQAIAIHATEENLRIADLDEELKRIRAFTEIVPQLKDLLTLRCMGTRGLDATIDTLKREYRELTQEEYRDPPCEQLLAQRG